MIQIGFDDALNWEFVSTNGKSPTQIFSFLPLGIAYALGLEVENVQMQSLQPFDTTAELGYITTLALAYIPSNLVPKLQVMLHSPSSPLYHYAKGNQYENSVNTITEHINPAIPLVAGEANEINPVGDGDEDNDNDDGNRGGGGDIFDTPVGEQSASTKGMIGGIATGAVVAAAAYGAAMFFIARRYKNKRLAHRRSRSVADPSEMIQSGSPALMGGAGAALMSGGRSQPNSPTNDRYSHGSGGSNPSARGQISAPVMAENSLGWN